MRGEYERQKHPIKVLLETADGMKRDVRITAYHGESLVNVLNSKAQFVEIEDESQQTMLLAKSFIRSMTPYESEPRASEDPVKSEKWRHHSQDPYIILDVDVDASDEEVRSTYHKLAMAYHPDRMVSLGLPPAMMEHGAEILKKINAAYEAVVFKRRKKKTSAA